MIFSTQEVLTSKKGYAEALGLMLIGFTFLVGVGLVVTNYALVSRGASQTQQLTQEITNRAEVYASALNANLLEPQVPPMTQECSTAPVVCTTILEVTPSEDGKQTVLRIQGDAISGVSKTLTKDVTLVSKEVTHVTALDENGNKVWGLSEEGLRYQVWGRASGEPTEIDPDDMEGPGIGASWVSVDDRAGIDSSGDLWLWGKNDIGQAGVGSTTSTPVTPKKFAGEASFRTVVTDDDRGYAIDSTGRAWVWGKNDKGQLGLGHSNVVTKPTKIADIRMKSFAIGKDNVLGVTMEGELRISGAAQAGLSTTASTTLQELEPGTKFRTVAASTTGAVALIDSLGTLSMAGNEYPFTPLPSGNFVNVSLGSTGGYALGGTGVLYSWGLGANGQLGLGTSTSEAIPKPLMSGKLFTSVSAAKTSAFAVDVSGNLFYFGKTPSGAVGGTDLPQVNVPTKLLGENRFRSVTTNSGDTAVALLDTSGNVYGIGTATPGLWPMDYLGADNQPIRMPVPDGFPSYTWE